jgi:hypothetical protein
MFLTQQPPVSQGLLIHEVSRSHTTTHHSLWDSSGRVISPSHRPLPGNTQHSKQTNIHAVGGIRTHNLNTRAAAKLRLRPRGCRDRQLSLLGKNDLIRRSSLKFGMRLQCTVQTEVKCTVQTAVKCTVQTEVKCTVQTEVYSAD